MERFENYQKTQIRLMRLMKAAMAYAEAGFVHGPMNSGHELSELKDAAEEFDTAMRKLG